MIDRISEHQAKFTRLMDSDIYYLDYTQYLEFKRDYDTINSSFYQAGTPNSAKHGQALKELTRTMELWIRDQKRKRRMQILNAISGGVTSIVISVLSAVSTVATMKILGL